MLHNYDWLKPGQVFPPRSEILRLKAYEDNRQLFEGHIAPILKPYIGRVREMVNVMKEKDHENDSFINIPNYWQLTSIKTADLLVGDAPTITLIDKTKEDELKDCDICSKLDELAIDIDRYGDSVVRVYKNAKGERSFVSMNPATWFPIVDAENPKIITAHVIAWVVCVYQDANHPSKNKYELNVQIHEVGKSKYLLKRFALPTYRVKDHIDPRTGERIENYYLYVIGRLIEEKEVPNVTGDCDIINFTGVTTSSSIYGISNYDRITEIAAELVVREALANYILDKNSAPRLAAPESAFVQNKEGRWVLKTGGRSFVVGENSQLPVYITWTGNLDSNEKAIERLRKELITMSEMSSIINDDDLNSSQGYDALEIKMTNPKLKVRRMATKMISPLKELIAKLLDTDKKGISILFNEGLPDSEMREIQKATAKKQLGYSFRTIAKEYFSMTDEEIDEEIDKQKEEGVTTLFGQFGIGEGFRNGMSNET